MKAGIHQGFLTNERQKPLSCTLNKHCTFSMDSTSIPNGRDLVQTLTQSWASDSMLYIAVVAAMENHAFPTSRLLGSVNSRLRSLSGFVLIHVLHSLTPAMSIISSFFEPILPPKPSPYCLCRLITPSDYPHLSLIFALLALLHKRSQVRAGYWTNFIPNHERNISLSAGFLFPPKHQHYSWQQSCHQQSLWIVSCGCHLFSQGDVNCIWITTHDVSQYSSY